MTFAVRWCASVSLACALCAVSAQAFTLTSTAFEPNEPMPTPYTCEGADRSPPLAWDAAPPNTKSFALIVDDPDAPDPAAPTMRWVHWVLYNIPVDARGLAEGASTGTLPAGAQQGVNDLKQRTYEGPCPPHGRHRYVFTLYALDTLLPNLGAASKATVEQSMRGHVLQKAELTGTYQKRDQ